MNQQKKQNQQNQQKPNQNQNQKQKLKEDKVPGLNFEIYYLPKEYAFEFIINGISHKTGIFAWMEFFQKCSYLFMDFLMRYYDKEEDPKKIKELGKIVMKGYKKTKK